MLSIPVYLSRGEFGFPLGASIIQRFIDNFVPSIQKFVYFSGVQCVWNVEIIICNLFLRFEER